MTAGSMYEYYARQSVRPTFADFGSDRELSRYEEMRKQVFLRLMIPPEMIAGRRLLEFGPDTGENSLVFAQWGAQLTLVEPHEGAHPYVRRYFDKFGLASRLDDIVAESLLDYSPARRFDLVDAEGFIYTIKPTSAWVRKMAECLEPGGFFVVSYVELFGSFIELLLKAIYCRVTSDSSYAPGLETAKKIFLPKWDSIAHTRKIESWFMDMTENPFVRLRYFIDPVDLLYEAHAAGFRLYSSWPNYRDALSIEWIKKPYSAADELRSSAAFIEQNRLSHVVGEKCFLVAPSKSLSATLRSLITLTDSLIDQTSVSGCRDAGAHVEGIIDAVKPGTVVTDGSDRVKKVLEMIRSAFDLMAGENTRALVEFCRSDEMFIASWGMPNHHAVYQFSP